MGVTVTPPVAVNLADNPKNRLYRATQSGTYSVSIPVGVYEVTRQATTNIIIGSTTLVPSTSLSILFVNQPQTSITFNSTVSSNVLPWTGYNRQTHFDIQRIDFVDNLFLAQRAGNNTLYVSTDGISWVDRPISGAGTGWNPVNLFRVPNDRYIWTHQGATRYVRHSTDLITWASISSQTVSQTAGGAFGNGTIVAAGISNSTTATIGQVIWATSNVLGGFIGPITLTNGEYLTAMTFANGLFVVGGSNGSMFTSTNGETWTYRLSAFGANFIRSIQYGNGIFVAAGSQNTVSTSTDGLTWTNLIVPGYLDFYNVIFNPDENSWALTDNGSSIRYSTDLQTWTFRSFVGGIREYAITYGNGKYLYAQYIDGTSVDYRQISTMNVLTPTVPFTDTYIILEYKGKTKVLA